MVSVLFQPSLTQNAHVQLQTWPARTPVSGTGRLQHVHSAPVGPGAVPASTSGRPTHLAHAPRHSARLSANRTAAAAAAQATEAPLADWVASANKTRMEGLEAQALEALKTAVESFEHPVFPCALIAGDVVILDLLHRLGYLANGRVPVIFIDTFHLFPETHDFLHQLEDKYGFKAHEFHADGFANVGEYRAVHGSDLFLVDIEKYDQICKVEPFGRALRELQSDVMINGRRRDHGAERAFLEVFTEGRPVNCQPLAHWTFADCFDYLKSHSLAYHPLHDQGFPSVGDIHSTVPVPREKWFEYAGERSGRFQGLTNPDGTLKTECGIHVGDPKI